VKQKYKNSLNLKLLQSTKIGKKLIDIFTKCWPLENSHLKVVTNEKGGGSGSCLVFEDGSGPWQSMSVYFLMLPSSFLRSISISYL
jgi:hypothetical protein